MLNTILKKTPIPLQQRSKSIIWGIWDSLCAYFCFHIHYNSIESDQNLIESIVCCFLISTCIFLLIGGMKHVAVSVSLLKPCDIENGALGILVLMSLIIRYIFVFPIWYSFLDDSLLIGWPINPSVLCKTYLLSKIGGFWILCSDLSSLCSQFFQALYFNAPIEKQCQVCFRNSNIIFTQCSHFLCKSCIDRSRKVSAACPICRSPISRKWTLPFSKGILPTVAFFLIL